MASQFIKNKPLQHCVLSFSLDDMNALTNGNIIVSKLKSKISNLRGLEKTKITGHIFHGNSLGQPTGPKERQP